jgi:hypothetical protein
MRNTIYRLGAVVALTLVLAGCKITGGPCSTEGSKHTNEDGTKYTCQKTDKGNLWAPDDPNKR